MSPGELNDCHAKNRGDLPVSNPCFVHVDKHDNFNGYLVCVKLVAEVQELNKRVVQTIPGVQAEGMLQLREVAAERQILDVAGLPTAHLCVVPCFGNSKVSVRLEPLGLKWRNPTGGTDSFLAVFSVRRP